MDDTLSIADRHACAAVDESAYKPNNLKGKAITSDDYLKYFAYKRSLAEYLLGHHGSSASPDNVIEIINLACEQNYPFGEDIARKVASDYLAIDNNKDIPNNTRLLLRQGVGNNTILKKLIEEISNP